MGSATAKVSDKCALWLSLTQRSLLIWFISISENPKSRFSLNLAHYSFFSLFEDKHWTPDFWVSFSSTTDSFSMVQNPTPICRISVPKMMKDQPASGFDLIWVCFWSFCSCSLCWFLLFLLGLQVYPKVKVREENELDDHPAVNEQKRSYLLSLKDLESLFLEDSSNSSGTL